MYKLFTIPSSINFKTGKENYLVGILFLDNEDINKLKKEGKWYKDNFNDILLEKIPEVVGGFITDLKSITILDTDFMVRKLFGDKKFSGLLEDKERYTAYRQKKEFNIFKIIRLMQKVLKTNEVNIYDFVKEISKDHDKSELWFEWHDIDYEGKPVNFYAPIGESKIKTLVL